MAKKNNLDGALAAVRKQSGEASAYRLTDTRLHSEVSEVIPTGIDALDHYAFQCGGLPCGRVSECWSEPHKGKTALGLQCLANAQGVGGVAVLIETEEALSEERIATFGVNREDLIIFNPDHVEQGLGQIGTFLEACPKGVGPFLFVWDSLAATQTREEMDQGPDGKDTTPGAMARAMSSRIKRLIPLLGEARAHLMFINQPRSKIGGYGNPEVTGGGSALKFYASLRFRIGSGGTESKIADASRGGEQVGHLASIKVHKNKLGFPFREITTRLMYDTGWDNNWTTVRLAKSLGLVSASTPFDAVGAAKAYAALEAVQWSPAEILRQKQAVAAQAAAEGDPPILAAPKGRKKAS